jgi:hypothetical protein
MKEDKLQNLLNQLADATEQSVPKGIDDSIKENIPHNLHHHRGGLDTVNIIIDLRIGKLAAAAAIIVTMLLFANFLKVRGPESGGIIQDSKLLIKYCLGAIDSKANLLQAKSRYEQLTKDIENVIYYGESVDASDVNAIVIQWQLPDGRYRVVFGDLHEETVTADELIKLQARMLKKRKK